MPRLFVGVMADAPTRAVAATAQACLRPALADARITWVAPAALHVTIAFLGEVPQPQVPAVREALAAPLGTPAFHAGWSVLGRFPAGGAPRVIWLGEEAPAGEWQALQAEVEARLRAVRPLVRERFHPHLTLGRVRAAGTRPVDLSAVLARCAPSPTAMRVAQVTLVESRLGPAGPSYTALTESPLA